MAAGCDCRSPSACEDNVVLDSWLAAGYRGVFQKPRCCVPFGTKQREICNPIKKSTRQWKSLQTSKLVRRDDSRGSCTWSQQMDSTLRWWPWPGWVTVCDLVLPPQLCDRMTIFYISDLGPVRQHSLMLVSWLLVLVHFWGFEFSGATGLALS